VHPAARRPQPGSEAGAQPQIAVLGVVASCSARCSPFALMVDRQRGRLRRRLVDLHVRLPIRLLLSALRAITALQLVCSTPARNWLRRFTLLPLVPPCWLLPDRAEFPGGTAGPEPLGGTGGSWWFETPSLERQHSRHPPMPFGLRSVQDLVLGPASS